MSNSVALVLRAAMQVSARPRRIVREAYAGAVTNRLTSFLSSGLQSPTKELQTELSTLRSRSRELCRNAPLAARYLRLVAENVVGRDGIALQARAVMRDGSPDEKANQRIEDAWWRWGRGTDCTVDRSTSFAGFCRRVAMLRAQDGEAFIRLHEGFGGNPFKFAVQLIDPDLVDVQYTESLPDGRPKVVMGVEVDVWGAPVAYHVLTRHPSETGASARERVRVPASEILHVFRKQRPGQVRGVPDLAPVMVNLDMLAGYVEAALVEARTAASKQGFIEQSPEADVPDPDTAVTQRVTETSPGSVDILGPGEKFVGWDPKSPSGNFGPFVTKVEQLIASGLNVSAMGLTGNLAEANYSSARTGLLQERDAWRIGQAELADQLCDPLYRRWLRMAVLTGELKLESDDLSRYEPVEWRGRTWGWVDPEKDVQAGALAIAYGLATPQDIVAEQGKDLRDVYQGLAQAQALAEELDIDVARPSGVQVEGDAPEPAPAPDPAAEEDRRQVAEAMREVAGAVKWIAGREQPQPIVNVAPPAVTVEAPKVDVRVGGPKEGSRYVPEYDANGRFLGAEFKAPVTTDG